MSDDAGQYKPIGNFRLNSQTHRFCSNVYVSLDDKYSYMFVKTVVIMTILHYDTNKFVYFSNEKKFAAKVMYLILQMKYRRYILNFGISLFHRNK